MRSVFEVGAMASELFLTFSLPDQTDQGEEPSAEPIRAQEPRQGNKRSHHTCDLCDKVIIGDLQWTGEATDAGLSKEGVVPIKGSSV